VTGFQVGRSAFVIQYDRIDCKREMAKSNARMAREKEAYVFPAKGDNAEEATRFMLNRYAPAERF
jgi:hypothetical protein